MLRSSILPIFSAIKNMVLKQVAFTVIGVAQTTQICTLSNDYNKKHCYNNSLYTYVVSVSLTLLHVDSEACMPLGQM